MDEYLKFIPLTAPTPSPNPDGIYGSTSLHVNCPENLPNFELFLTYPAADACHFTDFDI
jgi:hypothetical protein